MTNKLCSYGCGQESIKQFKNGKFCCSNRLQSCPAIRRKNSKSNKTSQTGEKNGMYGKKHTLESRRKNSEAVKKVWRNPNSVFNSKEWRNKISDLNTGRKLSKKVILKRIQSKNKFFCRIEEIRYNDKNKELEVHCKNHNCPNSKEKGGWFTPTDTQLFERIRQLESENGNGGSYLYCSEECKQVCPLYGLKNDPYKNSEKLYTQVDYEIFRDVVLKRDKYKCQYCNKKASEVHHERPQKLEPFFSLDPDLAWSVCDECHYRYGHNDECSTGNLAKIICI